MRFGEKILAVSKNIRRDLKDIAESAGIPYNTLRNYIKPNSKIMPNAPNGIALAKALGVSVEWLFDDSQSLPKVPYREPPPFLITPWPPFGITWEEVAYALRFYVDERTRIALEKMNERFREQGIKKTAVLGPLMPLFPGEEEDVEKRGAEE